MKSHAVEELKVVLPSFRIGTFALAILCLLWSGAAALAKEPSLTAIEIYDSPTGPAYLQLTDVLINGKAEIRLCSGCTTAPIDKNAYNQMVKTALAPGGVLERGADGILRYILNNSAAVVAEPFNAKFERKQYELSDLVDSAVLTGTAANSTDPPAPILKGVTLVFIAAPDVDLAEYLLAQRAASIPGWQRYLDKEAGGAHIGPAKTSLATLIVAVGEDAYNAYDKSSTAGTPAYDSLKTAKAQSDKAHTLVSELAPLEELDGKIKGALTAIAKQGSDELTAYHAALAAQTAGYGHLLNAKKYADIIGGIDPVFPELAPLQTHTLSDSNAIQSALRTAESDRDAKQFDDALKVIAPYRSFAGEEPRVADIISANYNYHLAAGKQAEVSANWPAAIREYENAAKAKDTAEARDSLKNAQAQLVIVQDKAAAVKALQSSKDYEAAHQIIRAYEVLANLPPTQRAQVTDDIERLQPGYVQAASQAAKDLRQAHDPIRGIADEVAIEEAYNYLQQAYRLSQDESYHDRMDLLGNDLSSYFLAMAKLKLAKPAGSGTELGWMYLTEAMPYKASNLDAVRDTMTAASAAHAIRSKLSIRVQFRDQTSQRDSEGFAGQLENAIITGLEGANIPVKVVRAGEVTPVEPDYQLDGDVLQHHLTTDPVVEAVESKYRAGTKEVPSPEWTKLNRVYEKAQLDSQAALAALNAAAAPGANKKDIAKLSEAQKTAQKAVEPARAALDATPATVTEDIIRPYNYTKRTVNVTGMIQLQFRVEDALSGQKAEPVSMTKEGQKKYVLLENVKQEDTEGVQESGTMPDTADFMRNIENSALQALVEGVRKHVEELPQNVYAAANALENEADLDGAGEAYLRFLYIAPNNGSKERKHAVQFLESQFNMAPPISNSTQ